MGYRAYPTEPRPNHAPGAPICAPCRSGKRSAPRTAEAAWILGACQRPQVASLLSSLACLALPTSCRSCSRQVSSERLHEPACRLCHLWPSCWCSAGGTTAALPLPPASSQLSLPPDLSTGAADLAELPLDYELLGALLSEGGEDRPPSPAGRASGSRSISSAGDPSHSPSEDLDEPPSPSAGPQACSPRCSSAPHADACHASAWGS